MENADSPGETEPTGARLDGAGELPFEAAADAAVIVLPPSRPDVLIPVTVLEAAGPAEASRDQCILNGYRQTLETGVATLGGCKSVDVRWMEKFGDWTHAECIGGWEGADSAAAWEFRTMEPGAFYLDLEYTCPAEDDYSERRVRCGDADPTFPLIDTGERPKRAAFGGVLPRFRTYRVGVIGFPAPGAQQLTLGPTGTEGKNIRVSSLILTPVEYAQQAITRSIPT